jgi:hypothetical protein
MSEIRDRLAAHQNDVRVVLQEVSRTSQLHAGFRLACAVSHLARAQTLLAEELDGLPGETEQPETSPKIAATPREEDTPVDGIGLRPKPHPEGPQD